MVRYTDPDGRFIPIILAAIAEAPEIYLLGAAVVASVTASIHHYQKQHQSSSSYRTYNNQSTTQPATQNAKSNYPPPPNGARQERKQQGHASKNVGAKQKTGHDNMVANGAPSPQSDGGSPPKGDPKKRWGAIGTVVGGTAAGVAIGIQMTNPDASKDANDAHMEKEQKRMNPEPLKPKPQDQQKQSQIIQQPN